MMRTLLACTLLVACAPKRPDFDRFRTHLAEPQGGERQVLLTSDGGPAAVLERWPDRQFEAIFGLDPTRPSSVREQTLFGATTLFDENHDGTFERRRREQLQADSTILVIEEQLSDAGYIELQRFTLSNPAH
ncbi:MAG: hypothetical protein IPJ65_15655 [Archangiaceae bacterium]|nr:hypothetical protein [Archangiaceae bacterium]